MDKHRKLRIGLPKGNLNRPDEKENCGHTHGLLELAVFKIRDLEVSLEEGFAIDKPVEAIINSANNGLLLGASGAGRIRQVTGNLPRGSEEEREFYQLCKDTGNIGVRCLDWLEKQKAKPTYVQLGCLWHIKRNRGRPLDIGSAVITTTGELAYIPSRPSHIIHAVGIGYTWPNKKTKGDLIPATREAVSKALENSMNLVRQYDFGSLSLPLMCARTKHERTGEGKIYGLSPRDSYTLILEALSNKQLPSLKRAVICADNSESRKYFESLGGQK